MTRSRFLSRPAGMRLSVKGSVIVTGWLKVIPDGPNRYTGPTALPTLAGTVEEESVTVKVVLADTVPAGTVTAAPAGVRTGPPPEPVTPDAASLLLLSLPLQETPHTTSESK